MKKISILLMVAVLAVGFVFAETTFTGSANLDFDYNLDSQAFALTNAVSGAFDWSYTLDSGEFGGTGEGDLYAVIAADFSFDFTAFDSDDGDIFADYSSYDTALTLTPEITQADIVYKDLTIGILDAGSPDTYATDFDDDATDAMDGFSVTVPAGFNFVYGDFSGGFGLTGDVNDKLYDVYLWGGVADYAVSDTITASANGFVNLANTGNSFGFAAMAAYATDDVSADLAVDYESVKNLEVAANATVAGVTANVYAYTADFANFDVNAKVATTVADFDVYVSVDDIYTTARSLEVGESATFDALTEEASVSYTFLTKVLAPSETLTYTTDMFEVYETVTLGLDLDATSMLTSVKPEVGISSDVIVNGATLSATWADAQFVGTKSLGSVTASCTIEF